jgi:predicted nucleic acid-binding protein
VVPKEEFLAHSPVNELDEKLQKKLKNLKINEVKIWLEQNL